MTEEPVDRCGYTWLGDGTTGDQNHENCCYRPKWKSHSRCILHTKTDEEKPISEIKSVLASERIRTHNTSVYLREDGEDKTPAELLDGVHLPRAKIGDRVSFNNCFIRDANLCNADLSNTTLYGSNLAGADLVNTDLTQTNLESTDLAGAKLREANLKGADLKNTDLTDGRLLSADLTDGDLRGANLTNAHLRFADLTNADLRAVNLTDADLESSTLIGTNLFDADLTRMTPYGARIDGVKINDETNVHTNIDDYKSWWQMGAFTPPQRCGYDLELREGIRGRNDRPSAPPKSVTGESKKSETLSTKDREILLSKAADTYRQFEELARNNTRPSLQSTMFTLRQEMQRKRYWKRGEYFQYSFAVGSRYLFKHGESLARILIWGFAIIVGFAAVYANFELILTGEGGFIESPVDALYFSTLTFTTLGLGGFQPDPVSQVARALVTTQAALGATLLAVFVFVLGRRAAR